MASFMSMQYDSDSDSADDLDFEPASDASDASSGDSGSDMDEVEDAEEETVSFTESSPTVAPKTPSKPTKRNTKKTTATSTHAADGTTTATPTTSGNSSQVTASIVSGTIEITMAPGNTVSVATLGATGASSNASVDDPAAPIEVVKKKKGPKKGTKYKKRTPAGPDESKASAKAPKVPRITKKAVAAAAQAQADSEAARNAQATPVLAGRFGHPAVHIDLDHPLETFKWPYSPFTPEFKAQHSARNDMASNLHQAVQQITDANGRAIWHLQELDQQLQMSRQDLKTNLDEIQFRKSQLRDMSLLAADIVKKLSMPRPVPKGSVRRRSQSSASSGAASGSESGVGGYSSSYQTTASHLDDDRMDMDDEVESGGEHTLHQPSQQRRHYPQDSHDVRRGHGLEQWEQPPQSLKGLNEGNVRSFLERIRALEQAQQQPM
ncbi:hypothetical protein EDD11_003732 [Mortierella claussenii]|nr:hypothetical protein EDD11_003732 [Mortierella claussenii]